MQQNGLKKEMQERIQSMSTIKQVVTEQSKSNTAFIVKLLFFICFVILFLPWTQNIQSNGYVSILHPDDRPQKIQTIIAGKIERWYVKEGDFVKKNDTILVISEVKSEYLDPQLLRRTQDQLDSKKTAVKAYDEKINALENQERAFESIQKLKIKQSANYLKQSRWKANADSLELAALNGQYEIAVKQLVRTEELYEKGIKSLTDLELKRVKVQEVMAKKTSMENKFLSSKNEVLNAEMDIQNVRNDYDEKLSKVRSEQFTALSAKFDAIAVLSKLQNQFANYEIRQGQYIIKASRDGYVTKLLKSGTGENVKEGEELIWIMPEKYNLAVEFYVAPNDYPLLKVGEDVRVQFDGWPAIVFTGWPHVSTGTYSGIVYAIDQNIHENGMYRVLVKPNPKEEKWPEDIRFGSGAKTFVLLNDVPIWYELWRNLNGFPPDYYQLNQPKKSKK